MFGRQSAQRFNHAFFYIRFYQHFPQKHHHPYAVGEEGEYLEREFRAMQKVVDRYYHAEIDGDHLRKPRDLVFRGRARKIEQVEFRHGERQEYMTTGLQTTGPRKRLSLTRLGNRPCCRPTGQRTESEIRGQKSEVRGRSAFLSSLD